MNFKCFIDRIDKVDGRLRIVDYKTGSDDVKFQDIKKDLFEPKKERRKAILQLLLYCNAYAKHEKYDSAIQPVVYQIKEINKYSNTEFFVKVGTDTKFNILQDYRTDVDNESFLEEMKSVVGEIFDADKKFTQTKNREKCVYCQFNKICNPNED